MFRRLENFFNDSMFFSFRGQGLRPFEIISIGFGIPFLAFALIMVKDVSNRISEGHYLSLLWAISIALILLYSMSVILLSPLLNIRFNYISVIFRAFYYSAFTVYSISFSGMIYIALEETINVFIEATSIESYRQFDNEVAICMLFMIVGAATFFPATIYKVCLRFLNRYEYHANETKLAHRNEHSRVLDGGEIKDESQHFNRNSPDSRLHAAHEVGHLIFYLTLPKLPEKIVVYLGNIVGEENFGSTFGRVVAVHNFKERINFAQWSMAMCVGGRVSERIFVDNKGISSNSDLQNWEDWAKRYLVNSEPNNFFLKPSNHYEHQDNKQALDEALKWSEKTAETLISANKKLVVELIDELIEKKVITRERMLEVKKRVVIPNDLPIPEAFEDVDEFKTN